jgi:hypothetical protein
MCVQDSLINTPVDEKNQGGDRINSGSTKNFARCGAGGAELDLKRKEVLWPAASH